MLSHTSWCWKYNCFRQMKTLFETLHGETVMQKLILFHLPVCSFDFWNYRLHQRKRNIIWQDHKKNKTIFYSHWIWFWWPNMLAYSIVSSKFKLYYKLDNNGLTTEKIHLQQKWLIWHKPQLFLFFMSYCHLVV